jgi:hypothetical protein
MLSSGPKKRKKELTGERATIQINHGLRLALNLSGTLKLIAGKDS